MILGSILAERQKSVLGTQAEPSGVSPSEATSASVFVLKPQLLVLNGSEHCVLHVFLLNSTTNARRRTVRSSLNSRLRILSA